MMDLSDALRDATEDVVTRDDAEGPWREGRRRRARGWTLAAGAGFLALGLSGLGLALAGGEHDDGPTDGPIPVAATTTATLVRTGGTMSTDDPQVWSDPRLTSPAPAPAGSTWVILVLDRQAGEPPADAAHLDGTRWRQVPGSTYPWTGHYQEVAFEKGDVSMTGGCAAGAGRAVLDGDRLRAQDYAVSLVGCEDTELMTMDARAADLVHEATVVLGDDGRLYLGGYVRNDHLPVGWTSDNRLGPYRGPRQTTLPPWAHKGTGPHTEPGPRPLD